MTAERLLVDTNVLIKHWSGDPRTGPILQDARLHISFVTEIGILSYHGYTAEERSVVTHELGPIAITDLEPRIKEIAIDLRRRFRMKLADSLIAATAVFLGIPLVTEDKHFKRLKEEIALYMV